MKAVAAPAMRLRSSNPYTNFGLAPNDTVSVFCEPKHTIGCHSALIPVFWKYHVSHILKLLELHFVIKNIITLHENSFWGLRQSPRGFMVLQEVRKIWLWQVFFKPCTLFNRKPVELFNECSEREWRGVAATEWLL